MNPLVAGLGGPPIPAAKAWARNYDGGAGPLIDLSQAVPGAPPPPFLAERLAASAAARESARYGEARGDESLRQAYAAEVSRLYRAPVGEGEVAITAGCNMAFFAAVLAVAKAGDAVVLPTPWYFNHQMTLAMLGIEARPLPCRPERGFVPDPEEARGLLGDGRVRAIVLVTPNNPTGAIYPPEVIMSFASLCHGEGLTLILDETYRDFLAGPGPPHAVLTGARRKGLIQLYSFSKAYCIPGHRVGALVADPATVAGVETVLDCLQICPPRTAQGPLAEAIPALRSWRDGNRDEVQARVRAFSSALDGLEGWRIDSIGAYFAYVAHPLHDTPAEKVAERLARECGVLALPGSFFGPGQEGYLRLAFANVGERAIRDTRERLRGFAG